MLGPYQLPILTLRQLLKALPDYYVDRVEGYSDLSVIDPYEILDVVCDQVVLKV